MPASEINSDLREREGTGAMVPSPAEGKFIGDIIKDIRSLSAEQVEQVLNHQRVHGVRFGEAAVALGFATQADVLHALSAQYNYAVASSQDSAISKEVIAFHQPFGLLTESFRAARAQLVLTKPIRNEVSPADFPTRTTAVAVTSCAAGDGKSFFCANLGVVLAQSGKRTLILDADLRGGRQAKIFGLPETLGLVGLLSGRVSEPAVSAVHGIPNLFVLPAGNMPPNPQELLESTAFALLLHELQGKFDHIIIDTSAQALGADFLVVAARCQSILVVGRKHRTKLRTTQKLIADCRAVGADVAGVVMNEH